MIDLSFPLHAPRGSSLNTKGWLQEAVLRCLLNNLDPDVAEDPENLVVYGGRGKAARNLESLHAIVRTLERLENDETLLVQSGKPVGVFRTHEMAPRVLIANSLLVPRWATLEHFWKLEAEGLMMYGQMTAGSWIYIGTQGILQGTYQTFCCHRRAASSEALGGNADPYRRPRGDGWSPTIGDHDERGRRTLHRCRSTSHPAASGDQVPR